MSATPSIAPSVRVGFGRQLRSWYRRNARDLPWRRTRDPYRVLVSELMLQQTQVSRVVDKYGEFLEQFPTLGDVARAQSGSRDGGVGRPWLLRARAQPSSPGARGRREWRRRASDGQLPADPEALRALPGHRRVHGRRGRVVRLRATRGARGHERRARAQARLRAVDATRKPPKASAVWEIAESILPRTGRATWTHNQALMELGALVCTARIAHCDRCPVRSICDGRRNLRCVEPRRADARTRRAFVRGGSVDTGNCRDVRWLSSPGSSAMGCLHRHHHHLSSGVAKQPLPAPEVTQRLERDRRPARPARERPSTPPRSRSSGSPKPSGSPRACSPSDRARPRCPTGTGRGTTRR